MKGTTNQKNKKSRMAVTNAASKKEYKQSRKNFSNAKKSKNLSSGLLMKFSIFFIMIIIAFVFIFVSGAFGITEIMVEGNNLVSNEQIISFSGIKTGTNLFAISKTDIVEKLERNSYIDTASVKRVLPNKVKLIVEERTLEYVLKLANSYVYMDRCGHILKISNDKPNVPIILGFTTDLSNVKENDTLNKSDLSKMNMVIKIMNVAKANDLANLITKIDVSNENNYMIYLDSEGKVAYLGNGAELNTRFLYIKSILKEQQGKSGEIFVNVDLNTEYVFFRESV